MQRGIIASPAIISIHGNGFTMERSISPEEVRYYALYWDKIVIPGSNLVYVAIPEEDVLVETGVIDRPRVGFSGTWSGADVGNSFALAQSVVAKKLIEEDTSTDWVIHQIGANLNLPSEFLEKRKTLRLDLINLLPVPSGDVPIVDVLEFKQRRADELNNLHSKLELAYIEALKSPDQDLASKLAIRDLNEAIQNLQTVASEKWLRTPKFDFSLELNLDGSRLIQSVAAGAVFDFFTNGFAVPIGSIIGGVVSVFNLKASHGASFIPAAKQEKLAYLSHAQTERII